MAGHARYTALLDAWVLYPVALSDAPDEFDSHRPVRGQMDADH